MNPAKLSPLVKAKVVLKCLLPDFNHVISRYTGSISSI